MNKQQLKGMILRAKKAGAKGYDIILSMSRDLSVSPDKIVKMLEKNRLIGMTEPKLRKIIKKEIQKEWVSLQDDNYGKVVLFFNFVAKQADSKELIKLAKVGQKLMGKMSKYAGGGRV